MIILFDLGGVFVPDSTEVLNREIAEYIGMPESELAAKWTNSLPLLFTGKMTIRDFYYCLLRGKFDPDLVLNKHISIYLRLYSIDFFMLDLLSQLKKRCVTACLSNTELEVARVNQEQGLYEHFHHAFLSTEMGLRKPEHDIFIYAIKRLGSSCNDIIFVDDKLENIETAKSLGIRTILFQDRQQVKDELLYLIAE